MQAATTPGCSNPASLGRPRPMPDARWHDGGQGEGNAGITVHQTTIVQPVLDLRNPDGLTEVLLRDWIGHGSAQASAAER